MAFAIAWERRHNEKVESANAGIQTIGTMSLVNEFGLSDLESDPKHFVNSCMARYYGIE